MTRLPTTRRVIAPSIVAQQSLPYNLAECATPQAIYEFWKTIVETQPDHEPDKERVVTIMLDAKLRPFAWNLVSIGHLSEASAHPREILRPVIATAAFGFVMMHNHPSGDPTPSRADDLVTRRLVECAEMLQVRLLDHVIIGRPAPGRTAYYSFREAGTVA